MAHFDEARKDAHLAEEDPDLWKYLVSIIEPLLFWRKASEKESEPPRYVGVVESLPSRFDDFLLRFEKVIKGFILFVDITRNFYYFLIQVGKTGQQQE